jgi:hypothetical protein
MVMVRYQLILCFKTGFETPYSPPSNPPEICRYSPLSVTPSRASVIRVTRSFNNQSHVPLKTISHVTHLFYNMHSLLY